MRSSAELEIMRLHNMTSFDEGYSLRELSLIEREIKSVLERYFYIENKSIEILFSKSDGEITVRIK